MSIFLRETATPPFAVNYQNSSSSKKNVAPEFTSHHELSQVAPYVWTKVSIMLLGRVPFVSFEQLVEELSSDKT